MATENDKINTGVLATLVVVGSLATLAVALGVDALVRYETADLGSKREQGRSQGYRTLAAEQKGKLVTPPSWADKGKEVVSMPIDRAMQAVLADLKRDPLTATAEGDPDAGAPHDADAGAQGADAGMDDAGHPQAADAGPTGTPSATPAAAPSGTAPTAAQPGAAPTAPAPLGATERKTPAQPAASAAPKGAPPPSPPGPVPPKPTAPPPTDG